MKENGRNIIVEIINRSQYDWNNHKILQRNREPSHVDFYPFEDLRSAKIGDVQQNSRVQMLNGLWSFEWFDCPWKVTEEIINKKVTDEEQKIQVPLNWQYAGFGVRCYTNILYPFPVDPPFAPNQNETGVYRRNFQIEDTSEKHFIRFEGVESAFHIYINGTQVGYSQGSRLPSEFDITNFVICGENQITVVVYQYSDGSYLEDQDMWRLGGIIRDVVLIHRPNSYLQNCILDPDFDVETGEGVLNPQILVSNSKSKIIIDVWSMEGKRIDSFELENEKKKNLRIKNILPWTAETPNTYIITLQVQDIERNTLEVIRQQIGFRHIEIENGILKLNGRRIFMRGINRHEYNPKTGRAITKEQIYEEILLIKEAGCNAIRCSHYPNQPYFYEVCDCLGIYVIDECDLETHGLEPINQHQLLCNNPEWESAYLDRIERMVSRDRNHPCVLLWSLGNEASYGKNFQEMYRWCKENEPSRPVHYEGDFKNQSVDVSSTMYSSIGELKELDLQMNPKIPHVLCEFGHAMGNGPGSLKEYCQVCEESQRIQGMFVWEFKDHGVEAKFPNGEIDYKFGGEFGESVHSGNFCVDGLVRSDGVPTPGFWEYSKQIQAITVEVNLDERVLFVKNKFDFLDLSAFTCKVSIVVDGIVEESLYLDIPVIESKSVGEIKLPKELFCGYEENQLVTWNFEFLSKEPICHRKTEGWKVGQESILFQNESAINENLSKCLPKVEVKGDKIFVSGSDFSLEIALSDGRIRNYMKSNKLFLNAGPILNYNRPYTDNDELIKEHWIEKHLHSMQMNISTISYEGKDSLLCIECQGKFSPKSMEWGTNVRIFYCITGDGEVVVSLKGEFYGSVPEELPKIGTQSELPKEFHIVKWRGFGPEECYNDSYGAQMDGIWEREVEKMGFAYTCPQENGNRTGVCWSILKNEKGQGIVVSTDSKMDMSVRCYSDLKLENARHNCELEIDDSIYWNLDYINSGLGSGSCGPSAMPQYKAYPIPFQWNMILKCFDETEQDIQVARKALGSLNYIKKQIL